MRWVDRSPAVPPSADASTNPGGSARAAETRFAGAGPGFDTFESGRRRVFAGTRLLVWLFAVGVIVTVATTWLVVVALIHLYGHFAKAPVRLALEPTLWIGGVCVAVVLVGSLVAAIRMLGGGPGIAELLGGVQVPIDTRDPELRRLVNVVEEMGIASGSPMPAIYLIECDSINAFAAGQSPEAAVIGVTRGSLRKLGRDELQGVIAHEFSHIRHQDTRINARAAIAIAGLMAIGTIGKILVFFVGPGLMVIGGFLASSSSSSSRRSRGRNSDAGGALAAVLLGLLAGLVVMAIGLVFWAIGSSGVLYGRIVQAAISRGREFLADATAVDYTRNPDGIANALRKIRDARNPGLPSWAASGLNHFLFTSGVGTILDSHPSIRERIRRLVAMGASPQYGD